MAAGLQCLTATPPVLRHFLDLQQRGEKLPPPGSLMAHFSVLLGKMWSGRYSVLRPTEFKQTLGAYHSQFKDYRQVSVRLFAYSINCLSFIIQYEIVLYVFNSMIVKNFWRFYWIPSTSK